MKNIIKGILGFQDIEATGNMHVETLKKRFEESFNTTLRVYSLTADGRINTGKGARPADPKSTLASNSPPSMKIHTITIRKSHTIGDIEKAFAAQMGIGIQIMSPDGETFAPNNMKLKEVHTLVKSKDNK
jgi:hypothetical protein